MPEGGVDSRNGFIVDVGGFDGFAGIDDGEGDVGVFVVLLKDGAGFRAFLISPE